jgi:hypothetical protein
MNSDINSLILASQVLLLHSSLVPMATGILRIKTKVLLRFSLLLRLLETFHRLKLSSKRLLLKLVHVASALVGQLNLSRTLRT